MDEHRPQEEKSTKLTEEFADPLRQRFYSSFFVKRRAADPRKLLVIFGHNPGYAFFKFPFDYNTLFISDRAGSYYTREAGKLAKSIALFIEANQVKDVVFLGCSKAGYGVLLVGPAVAVHSPMLNVKVLTFSPQTQIYPVNELLTFPSYHKLIERSKSDDDLLNDLKRYGHLLFGFSGINCRTVVIYGELHMVDKKEVARLNGRKLEKIALSLSTHLSIIPFICDTSDKAAVGHAILALHQKSGNDEDAIQSIGELAPPQLERELLNLPRQPTLQSVVNSLMDDAAHDPWRPHQPVAP